MNPVIDLDSLRKLLKRFEDVSSTTIIKGSLIEGKTTPVMRSKETCAAKLRQCCVISIDNLVWE